MSQQIFDSVRNQYRCFYRRMAFEGMAWNLHRNPETDQFTIHRSDCAFDVPLPVAVPNVHAMTETRLLQRVQDILRA